MLTRCLLSMLVFIGSSHALALELFRTTAFSARHDMREVDLVSRPYSAAEAPFQLHVKEEAGAQKRRRKGGGTGAAGDGEERPRKKKKKPRAAAAEDRPRRATAARVHLPRYLLASFLRRPACGSSHATAAAALRQSCRQSCSADEGPCR